MGHLQQRRWQGAWSKDVDWGVASLFGSAFGMSTSEAREGRFPLPYSKAVLLNCPKLEWRVWTFISLYQTNPEDRESGKRTRLWGRPSLFNQSNSRRGLMAEGGLLATRQGMAIHETWCLSPGLKPSSRTTCRQPSPTGGTWSRWTRDSSMRTTAWCL